MSLQRVIFKSVFCTTLVMGTGLLLFKYTVPSEQQQFESLPEGLKVQMKNQQSEIEERKKLFMQVIKANTESNLPIWDVRGLDSLPKPHK